MLKAIYIIVAIICAMLSLSLFGYGIAHGATFFYAVFPLVLAIFALPLLLEKRLRAKSPRLASLAYAVPLIALTGPLVYLFLLKPWYEGHVGRAILNEVRVAVVDETLIKNRNGHPIGLKIQYTFELPETVAYGGTAKKLLEHAGFPNLHLRGLKSPQETFTGFDIFYQNGRRVPLISGIESGKYTVESWRVPALVLMQGDGFCKSTPWAGMPESIKEAIDRALDFPRQPFVLELGIRVLKSYRMGYFEHDFRLAYTTKNELDGPELRKAVEELPPCDAGTKGGFISPPKSALDHLQDFVAP